MLKSLLDSGQFIKKMHSFEFLYSLQKKVLTLYDHCKVAMADSTRVIRGACPLPFIRRILKINFVNAKKLTII